MYMNSLSSTTSGEANHIDTVLHIQANISVIGAASRAT
jgi:hypothetical protein